MIALTLNDRILDSVSLDQVELALAGADAEQQFELWVSVPDGPSMSMLRNGESAFLVYLRAYGDSGFISVGDPDRPGIANFTLSNGQVDEFPLSWCIAVDQCYKAIASFYVNEGAKPERITWHEA